MSQPGAILAAMRRVTSGRRVAAAGEGEVIAGGGPARPSGVPTAMGADGTGGAPGTGRPAAAAGGACATDILSRLRGVGRARPLVDRAAVGGLRELIEDELAGWPGSTRGQVVAGWWVLPTSVTAPEAGEVGSDDERRVDRLATTMPVAMEATPARARLLDGLVRALFRQWVTCRRIDDPLDDALAGITIAGDPAGVAAAVAGLGPPDRAILAGELDRHVDQLVRTWPVLDPRWAPRTGERWMVPVAGGRAVLVGRPDLVLGRPARDQASVGLVAATTGATGSAPWRRVWFAALVETLRAGAAPFQVAVYTTATGRLAVRPVTAEDLIAAAHSLVGALRSGTGDRPAGRSSGGELDGGRPASGAVPIALGVRRGAVASAHPLRASAGSARDRAARVRSLEPAPRRRRVPGQDGFRRDGHGSVGIPPMVAS